MSRERIRSSKLAQARRRNDLEHEDGETGPAIIDDSGSDIGSDDDLELTVSENEEEEADDVEQDEKNDVQPNKLAKEVVSPPTSEGYDRLEDDTLNPKDFVDLAASRGSLGESVKVSDTSIIMNGFKGISAEGESTADNVINFDELDDSITFEPRTSDATRKPSSRGAPPSRSRGASGGRPERETYWQRRNKEKEEYKKRLEDPTFTPFVGDFFMHDSRKNRQFESLNQYSGTRGRGRGGRGFRGGPVREMTSRKVHKEEPVWGHDGFEELEPGKTSKTSSIRVCQHCRCTNRRNVRKVRLALLVDKPRFQTAPLAAEKTHHRLSQCHRLLSREKYLYPAQVVLAAQVSILLPARLSLSTYQSPMLLWIR